LNIITADIKKRPQRAFYNAPEFDTPRTKNVQQVLDLGPLLNEILAEIETAS
jgi:hypothetical protein